MIQYAEVLRRLDAGESFDPTQALKAAGKAMLQEGVERRIAHVRRLTPNSSDRTTKPPEQA